MDRFKSRISFGQLTWRTCSLMDTKASSESKPYPSILSTLSYAIHRSFPSNSHVNISLPHYTCYCASTTLRSSTVWLLRRYRLIASCATLQFKQILRLMCVAPVSRMDLRDTQSMMATILRLAMWPSSRSTGLFLLSTIEPNWSIGSLACGDANLYSSSSDFHSGAACSSSPAATAHSRPQVRERRAQRTD